MDRTTSDAYMTLAGAFCYPAPGRLDALKRGLTAMPKGGGKDAYAAFVNSIGRLTLGEWEELHTRTLDLSPPAAPYVGYQTWGESYQRGAFLVKMNRALAEAGVEADGELPDHLAPSLRYLAATGDPFPEMIEILGPALQRMIAALRKAEPDNPYVSLLQSAQELCQGLKKEDA
jgi:nitrate reductase molybdenum cofactor assembly chaperone NarJ/NarW